jgi:hypothetical protein
MLHLFVDNGYTLHPMIPDQRMKKKIGRIAILLFFLGATGCAKGTIGYAPSRCPIDGAPAEYSKRISANSCQYSHFSAVERQMHSWVADCVK